jgi:transcription antitermination factor NusA-like protein
MSDPISKRSAEADNNEQNAKKAKFGNETAGPTIPANTILPPSEQPPAAALTSFLPTYTTSLLDENGLPLQMTIRVMIEARQSGGVIGQGGATVNTMRNTSGAKIEMNDSVAGARKRLIDIVGMPDQVSIALHLVAEALHEAKKSRNPAESADNVQVEFLAPNCQIGAVIGKGGCKIKITREQTGASVKVSDQPLDNSTEKSVTIRGTSEQVQQAIIVVVYQMHEGADKAAKVPWFPGGAQLAQDPFNYNALFAMSGGMGVPGGMPGQAAPPGMPGQGAMPGMYMPPLGMYDPQAFAQGMQQQQGGFQPALARQPAAAPQQEVVNIPVPDTLIGYVIGRGGGAVSEIRRQTGANIKISSKGEGSVPGQRMVTITGTHSQNELAVSMVHQKLAQHGGVVGGY